MSGPTPSHRFSLAPSHRTLPGATQQARGVPGSAGNDAVATHGSDTAGLDAEHAQQDALHPWGRDDLGGPVPIAASTTSDNAATTTCCQHTASAPAAAPQPPQPLPPPPPWSWSWPLHPLDVPAGASAGWSAATVGGVAGQVLSMSCVDPHVQGGCRCGVVLSSGLLMTKSRRGQLVPQPCAHPLC